MTSCRTPSARTRGEGLPSAFPFGARSLPAGDPQAGITVFARPAFVLADILATPYADHGKHAGELVMMSMSMGISAVYQ